MVRIQLTGEMFKFEGSPELQNVSGWVDWRQFATVKDAAGTQLTMEEMEALPGLCIRILCTPAGMWFLLNSTKSVSPNKNNFISQVVGPTLQN